MFFVCADSGRFAIVWFAETKEKKLIVIREIFNKKKKK